MEWINQTGYGYGYYVGKKSFRYLSRLWIPILIHSTLRWNKNGQIAANNSDWHFNHYIHYLFFHLLLLRICNELRYLNPDPLKTIGFFPKQHCFVVVFFPWLNISNKSKSSLRVYIFADSLLTYIRINKK